MSKRSGWIRGGSRVATGLALTAGAALLIVNLGLSEIDEVTREVPEVTVDTTQLLDRTIVCQGPFSVLGADVTQPEVAMPTGSATVLTSVEPEQSSDLEVNIEGKEPPRAMTSVDDPAITATQTQQVRTETVRGQATNACLEASNDQWVVGASTVSGVSATLVLSNPGSVAATVKVTMHDETGVIDALGASGVLVPAGSQRVVSLNGYGSGRESIAVRVESVGAPVVALLGASEIRDISPVGVDHVSAQAAPELELVFAGTVNYVDHTHSEDDSHNEEGDEFPAVLRLLAPDDDTAEGATSATDGIAVVTGLTKTGESVQLAEVKLETGVVIDTPIVKLPENVHAVHVEATVPVVGGFYTSTHADSDHDFTWMSPAPAFAAQQEAAVVVVLNGTLTLVNLGDREAEFEVSEASSGEDDKEPEPSTVTLKPGAAQEVKAPDNARITGPQPFAAGVTVFNKKALSSYPVVPQTERFESVRVLVR